MTIKKISCPMCGYRFDPAEHVACQSCPLNRGCQLVCCPACAYNTINPHSSSIVKFARRLLDGPPKLAKQGKEQ